MKVLDLFCGIGGFSSGFKEAGFKVEGAELSQFSCDTFNLNKIGLAKQTDLSKTVIRGDYDLIIGGPPCKPWSNVNRHTRTNEHRDYGLVKAFFKHIRINEPSMFIFENVPPIGSDPMFRKVVEQARNGYSIAEKIVRYSDYGAATNRKRRILVGCLNSDANEFFEELDRHKKQSTTVRDAIGYLREKTMGAYQDHDWPHLKTIEKYQKLYNSGQYGWYILNWNSPSPSFGNVMKTYILHPSARKSANKRVISVRETMSIFGFSKEFTFPQDAGLGKRYQAIVDSVSPVFSYVAANVARSLV